MDVDILWTLGMQPEAAACTARCVHSSPSTIGGSNPPQSQLWKTNSQPITMSGQQNGLCPAQSFSMLVHFLVAVKKFYLCFYFLGD